MLKSKKVFLFSVKLIIIFFCFYFLVKNIDLQDIIKVYEGCNYASLTYFLLLGMFIFAISSLKTKYLFNSQGISVSFKSIFLNNWAGQFLNNFTPAGTGADAYKFLEYKNQSENNATLLSIIFFDKIIGIIVLGINAIVFSSSLKLFSFNFSYYIFFIVLTVFSLISFFIYKRFKNYLLEKIPWKLFYSYKNLLVTILCYELIFCLVILSYKTLFSSINLKADLFIILKIVPVVFIGEYVPLTINSIGIREGLNVFLFGQFGFAKSDILFITIIGRILNLFLSLLGGIIILFKKYNGRNTRVAL